MTIIDLKSWLDAHADMFARELQVIQQTEDLIFLGHRGLTDKIRTRIQACGMINITLDHLGQCWDIVKDFDVSARQSTDGRYYCALCEQPEYYGSETSLWEHHSLREWAAWLNRIGTSEHEIRLLGEQGRMTTAHIVQSDKSHIDDADVHTISPVVVDDVESGEEWHCRRSGY